MKYAFAAVLFAAVAYAADTTTTAAADSTITAAPTHTLSVAEKCLAKCSADDSDCRAECLSNPFPHSSQLVGLDQCMSKECIPKQTIAANNYQAYGDCQQSCINKFYYNYSNTNGLPNVLATGKGGAAPTGTGSSGSGSGSGSDDSSKGGSGESGASGSGTATGTAAKASGSGSAGNKLTFSMGGLVGAIGLAAMAL